MSIKAHRRAGFTLIEILFFVILATIVVVAGITLATNFMRTTAFLTNSVDLDTKSRLAADVMSREIRQCDAVQAVSTNSLVLRLGTNVTTFVYRPDLPDKPILRLHTEDEQQTILTDVDFVRFDLFQHQLPNALYDRYEPATSPANCKIVQLNWVCTRYLLGFKANTTTMQSAKVVIRKQ